MPNIPGASFALPGPFTDVVTQSRGTAVPGGLRLAAMIGEGSTNETIVSSANGGGADGFNATFTSTTGSDGRHFKLQNFPLIQNRSQLFKNGLPLNVLEVNANAISPTYTFNTNYDAALDFTTGELLLQAAYLLDQGGSTSIPLTTNVGLGSVVGLTIVDANAPPEIWTLRCVSVQRTSMNQPIAGTAKFLAIGSVSGSKIDANGNPIVWTAQGGTVSNGVLKFSIVEATSMSVVISPFREGDAFTVIVKSGVLIKGDSLTSVEIPVANLNDPFQTQGMTDVVTRHGFPSTTNHLSLGAQLAYANGAATLITVQAAPPMPRRTSYIMDPAVKALSTNLDDFQFPFPIGVVPDLNSDIHVFIQNNSTLVEKQVLPNKFPFYTISTPQFPTTGPPTLSQFITSSSNPPAGFNYSYSIVQEFETLQTGFDGYIGSLGPATTNMATFGSPSVQFNSTFIGKILKVIDSTNAANVGFFNITADNDGVLTIHNITALQAPLPASALHVPAGFPDFVNETPEAFQLINPDTLLPITNGSGVDGTIVTSGANTATGTLTSTAVNFGTVATAAGYSSLLTINGGPQLQINGSLVGNNGLYDIIGYNSGTNTLTLAMAFVSESNVRYEVLDDTAFTAYLVVNKNIVPNGQQLRVTIVDARDASFYDAGWLNALDSLTRVECDILVPLPSQTISVIFQNCLAHCISMSNIVNKKERVLFCGAINGLKPANLTGATPAAVENIGILEGIQGSSITDVLSGNVEDLANYSVPDAFGNTFRCVYFYPDQIVVQAGSDNILIDGFYLAAAAAGHESADLRIENPLTNKVLSGFTILRNKQFSTLTLTQLAQAGVTTLQPVAGGGTVVWGLTTSQSGFPEEQEISIVFIRDRVAKTLRAGFHDFVGVPAGPNFGAILNTRAVILLNSLVAQGLITAYANLAVVQDSVDPTQWNVSVNVQPTYPVNFIYIKVNVGQLGGQ